VSMNEEDLPSLRLSQRYRRILVSADTDKEVKEMYRIPTEGLKRLRRAKNIFLPRNHEVYFISLDLRSANFNCLRNHDPELVLNCKSWDELAAKESPHESIRTSKFLRQIVLGTLAGKKQILMWRYITYAIFDRLVDEQSGPLKEEQIQAWSGDELIFAVPYEKLKETYRRVSRFVMTDEALQRYAGFVKVEPFRLICLNNSRYFVKEVFVNFDKDGMKDEEDEYASRPVIKCANAQEFAQCYKVYLGQDINDNDATINAEGQKKYIFT